MDTGPIVAWLCPRDQYHQWAASTFSGITVPVVTCEAVVAESCHLASKDGISPDKVLQFLSSGGIDLVPLSAELFSIQDLLRRYTNVPMDYADACLVGLAELPAQSTICTLDSDFSIYRKNTNESIPLINSEE